MRASFNFSPPSHQSLWLHPDQKEDGWLPKSRELPAKDPLFSSSSSVALTEGGGEGRRDRTWKEEERIWEEEKETRHATKQHLRRRWRITRRERELHFLLPPPPPPFPQKLLLLRFFLVCDASSSRSKKRRRRRKKSAQPSSSKYGCKNWRLQPQPQLEMEANYQTKIPFSSFFSTLGLMTMGNLGVLLGGPGPWKVILPLPFLFPASWVPPVISGFSPPPSSIHHRWLAPYASPETPPATERQFYHC